MRDDEVIDWRDVREYFGEWVNSEEGAKELMREVESGARHLPGKLRAIRFILIEKYGVSAEDIPMPSDSTGRRLRRLREEKGDSYGQGR